MSLPLLVTGTIGIDTIITPADGRKGCWAVPSPSPP